MSPSSGIAVNSNQALYGSRPVCPTAKLSPCLRAPKSPCDEGLNVVLQQTHGPTARRTAHLGDKAIASGSTKRDNLALPPPLHQIG